LRARQGRGMPASRLPPARARRGPPPLPEALWWEGTLAYVRPTTPRAPNRACCAAPARRDAPHPRHHRPGAQSTEPAQRRDSPYAPCRFPHPRPRHHRTGPRAPGCVRACLPSTRGGEPGGPCSQLISLPRAAQRFRPPRRPLRRGAAVQTA